MNYFRFFRAAPCLTASLIALMVAGCIDKDYDLGNVDMTVGLGGNISLPSDNSTNDICLDDVLDLGNTNFLKVEQDGRYSIDVVDDESFAAHMIVRSFTVPSKTYKGTYTINLGDFSPAPMKRVKKADDEIEFSAPMVDMDFTYSFNSSNITALDYIGVDNAKLTVTLSFSSQLKKALSNIKTMNFAFPKCITFGQATFKGAEYSLTDNNLTLHDIKTSEGLTFEVVIKGVDLSGKKSDDSYMTYTKGEGFVFHGSISAEVIVLESAVDFDSVVGATDLTVNGTAVLSKMTATSAKGRFTPIRSFDKVGGVSLKNIPSFLRDDEVDLDLYDPQLNLNIYSELPFATKMSGAIVSKDKNGKELLRINVPEFSYKANGNSIISIRRRPATASGDTTVVVLPNITDVIRTLPDSIALVDLEGIGDDSHTAEITLSNYYRGEIRMSVASGIALADDAVIVYKDDFAGWNDQVKEISFVESTVDGQKTITGYLEVKANVSNKIPAFLTLKAYGIDTEGNVIGSDKLEVEVTKIIKASPDGRTAATTEEVIYVRPKDNAVFKKLDGLSFRVEMSAKSGKDKVTGVMLNAYNQTLKITDISVKKYGKVAVDLN